MRYISLIRDDVVVAQMPIPENFPMTIIMELDGMLSDNGILPDDAEICVTEDC
jgi:hypothetical protein